MKEETQVDEVKLVIPMDIYSRVVGFYTPVRRWNKGKQAEFKDRQVYDVKQYREGKNEEEMLP